MSTGGIGGTSEERQSPGEFSGLDWISDRGTVTIESVFAPFLGVVVVGVVTVAVVVPAVVVVAVVGVAGVAAAAPEIDSGGSMVFDTASRQEHEVSNKVVWWCLWWEDQDTIQVCST